MKKRNLLTPFVMAIVLILIFPLQVNATEVNTLEGKVTFGSRYYTWYTGQVVPLGVYIESDAVISGYEIELIYDTEKLRYMDGASEQIGNHLYIRSNGTEKKYGYGETAFDVITYTSNTEMTSVSIYVTWYNENGQKIREKDTTLTVNKLVLGEGESFDGDEITHSPSQSGGPSDEGGADQDTTPLDPVEPTHEEQQ